LYHIVYLYDKMKKTIIGGVTMFRNERNQVRSGWKIAAVTAAIVAIIIVISLIVGIVVNIKLLASHDIDLKTLKLTEKGMRVENYMNMVLLFIQEVVMIITPIFAWKIIMRSPLSHMGLDSFKRHIKELIIGLSIGAVSISVVFFAIVLSGNAKVESWIPHFSFDTIIYLFLFILVGFAEEIYGRGFIMSTLRQTRSVPVIVIVSSIIFALLHSGNSGIGILPYINLTLVGLFFAYIYLKSGNIWMCIGYHITWNYFQGNVYGFPVSGMDTKGIITTMYEKNNIINGGQFGPEGGLLVTVVILIGFLFVNIFYQNSNYDFLASEPDIKEEIDSE